MVLNYELVEWSRFFSSFELSQGSDWMDFESSMGNLELWATNGDLCIWFGALGVCVRFGVACARLIAREGGKSSPLDMLRERLLVFIILVREDDHTSDEGRRILKVERSFGSHCAAGRRRSLNHR